MKEKIISIDRKYFATQHVLGDMTPLPTGLCLACQMLASAANPHTDAALTIDGFVLMT
jgi:hypothetical protein